MKKETKSKLKKIFTPRVIKIIIAAILLLIFTNPSILPVSADLKNQVQSVLNSAFGHDGKIATFSLPTIITALSVVAFLVLLANVLDTILDYFMKKGKRSKGRSVAYLLHSVVKYGAVIAGIIWVLAIFGVSLTGIFASLGIVSLIIGFGAESLIEDSITGIFIMLEDQYNIGDVIVLDNFRGTVRRIGIRTTTIEDIGGNLKIINNSSIRNLQNRSKRPSVAVCDFPTSIEVDVRTVDEILKPEMAKIFARHEKLYIKEPIYQSTQSMDAGNGCYYVRTIAFCKEDDIFEANRVLNQEMIAIYADHHIPMRAKYIVQETR